MKRGSVATMSCERNSLATYVTPATPAFPYSPDTHPLYPKNMGLKQDLWLSAHFMDIALNWQAFGLLFNPPLHNPLAIA